MATLILSSVGRRFAGSTGSALGAYIGRDIDAGLFDDDMVTLFNKRALKSLKLQTASYDVPINLVFGTIRVAGNVIWASEIFEGIGDGRGLLDITRRNIEELSGHAYFINLAIAVCAGPIDDILRIWIGDEEVNIDKLQIRIYKGTNTQDADSLMVSAHDDLCPAYRGLAYVVIENFMLSGYDGKLPVFSFEVKRVRVVYNEPGQKQFIAHRVEALHIGNGSGEFAYDARIQSDYYGYYANNKFIPTESAVNVNEAGSGEIADLMMAADHLANDYSSLEWICLTVEWYVDTTDIAQCEIYPAVNGVNNKITRPDEWSVAGISRLKARSVRLSGRDHSYYKGTVNDQSLIRAIQELRNHRKYKIMLRPVIAIDTVTLPAISALTGSVDAISGFFVGPNGYNRFIMHYANLLHNKIDAFMLGSGMSGITGLRTQDGVFPGTDMLVALAESVRKVLGNTCIITYGADWNEYHSLNGYYHMDKLWNSPAIDVVGINAYFSLYDKTDRPDISDLENGWHSGEDYDYVVTNGQKKRTTPIRAVKNIQAWWSGRHINPDGHDSGWVPEAKKIWFTSYGFAAIDHTANQPDAVLQSMGKDLPPYSLGDYDVVAQLDAIGATLNYWSASKMITNKFLWYFSVRSGALHEMRSTVDELYCRMDFYNVRGKIDVLSIGSVVRELLKKADIADIDTQELREIVYGMAFAGKSILRNLLDMLRSCYIFDIVDDGGIVKCLNYYNKHKSYNISYDNLIVSLTPKSSREIIVADYADFPNRMQLSYWNNNYEDAYCSVGNTAGKGRSLSVAVPMTLDGMTAGIIAYRLLNIIRSSAKKYSFALPFKYYYLMPGDILRISSGTSGLTHNVRITGIERSKYIRIKGNAAINYSTAFNAVYSNHLVGNASSGMDYNSDIAVLHVLDIADVQGEAVLYFAVSVLNGKFKSINIYQSYDDGRNYEFLTVVNEPTTIGRAVNALGVPSSYALTDNDHYLTVVTDADFSDVADYGMVFRSDNLALVGNEIIRFRYITLLRDNVYMLNSLIRGYMGTEMHMAEHKEGERFILLDSGLKRVNQYLGTIGMKRSFVAVIAEYYAGVGLGEAWGDAVKSDSGHIVMKYEANSLKPLAPVHLEAQITPSKLLHIKWIRRARINGEMRDYVDVPLDEEAELYDIEIYNAANHVLLHQANNINKPAYQCQLDILHIRSGVTLEITVFQISAVAGRGYGGKMLYEVTI